MQKGIENKKEWVVMPTAPDDFAARNPEMSRIVLQLLFNRGIVAQEEIDFFLRPDYGVYANNPYEFDKMAEAVDLVVAHIKEGDEIVIYGDYDADGVTSSAVLFETLTMLKGNVEVYIPDRVKEGYGINKKSLENIKQSGAKLIITVDNGIRHKKEIEYAISLGLDVIITDHHTAPEDKADLPDCLIINPKVPGENYPYKHLAGVGVAFKFAEAIIKRAKIEEDAKQEIAKRLLDLVAIGTVADCVSLTGENRALTSAGLKILNRRRRAGLEELMSIAKVNDRIDAWHIGWLIAPRINAAGRLDHARTAFRLLVTKDVDEAKMISRQLNENNIDRQKITEEIVAEVEDQIKDDIESGVRILIAASPSLSGDAMSWNEGVIGLAASRICDKYYLPTIIITGNGTEIKGSGRSISEFHITEALAEVDGHLERFGGHSAACGFTLKNAEEISGFADKMKAVANKSLANIDLRPKLLIESEVELDDIDEKLMSDIEKFEPFGESNQKPKFVSKNVLVVDKAEIGSNGQHLKLRVKSDISRIFTALGFGQSEQWSDVRTGDRIDVVYHLEVNRFNGREEIQMRIIDIKKI